METVLIFVLNLFILSHPVLASLNDSVSFINLIIHERLVVVFSCPVLGFLFTPWFGMEASWNNANTKMLLNFKGCCLSPFFFFAPYFSVRSLSRFRVGRCPP